MAWPRRTRIFTNFDSLMDFFYCSSIACAKYTDFKILKSMCFKDTRKEQHQKSMKEFGLNIHSKKEMLRKF